MKTEPGMSVWVDISGAEFPGEVLKVEHHGWVFCRIHTDPVWDFGSTTWVSPEQTVAVMNTKIRPRE